MDLTSVTTRSQTGARVQTITSHELIADWSGDAIGWFSRWLGNLNTRNAGLRWWAYASTSKNLLSSALGSRVLETLALRNLARSGNYQSIWIHGASPGQALSMTRLLAPEFNVIPPPVKSMIRKHAAHALAVGRVIFQAARILCAFRLEGARSPRHHRNIVLFTYLDGEFGGGADRYFGDLPDLVRQHEPAAGIAYVAYVYTPYRRRLRDISPQPATPYLPLFQYLSFGELLRALGLSIAATFPPGTHAADGIEAAAMDDLLTEALIEDVSRRGYLHNMLVYSGIMRMVRCLSPDTLIYPYENKSLEKTLLLGARAASQNTRLIGYQHTSVTPRHIGLRFEPEEAGITPLPDRIVTVGSITRDYLEQTGNYPGGMLVAGCALRQKWEDPLPPQTPDRGRPRILLALSSSIGELVSAVDFMRRVKAQLPELELGVRPHLNFPLTSLPTELLSWVRSQAADLSGTALRDNLAWADVTAYISSTVALESLMLGRPVIYLAIDPSNPDPLLGKARLRWTAGNIDEFLTALSAMAVMDEVQMNAERNAALDYVRNYLSPKSPQAIAHFLR